MQVTMQVFEESWIKHEGKWRVLVPILLLQRMDRWWDSSGERIKSGSLLSKAPTLHKGNDCFRTPIKRSPRLAFRRSSLRYDWVDGFYTSAVSTVLIFPHVYTANYC